MPRLMRDRTKVVRAKADRPRGAGLAMFLLGALRARQSDIARAYMDVGSLPIETWLKLTTEGRKAKLRVVGADVGERVAAVIVRRPLLGNVVTGAGMVDGAGAVGLLGGQRGILYQTSQPQGFACDNGWDEQTYVLLGSSHC